MRKQNIKYMVVAATVSLGLFATSAQAAESYPDKPITMVVGFAAGGATDILARLVAKGLAEELDQAVVVENRAGAGSNIGADYVNRSKADGYTLYVGSITNGINYSLYDNLQHDFIDDFEHVGMLARITNVLVVNPDRPYKTVDEYIAYAKAHPGEVTCASSSIGSSIHMSCELFKLSTGTDILHVPYRGSGPAVTDLVAGQVDSMFDNVPSAISHIKANNLRALATTTEERTPMLPDVPTFAEEGIEDFVVSGWFGLEAPKGTPDNVVETLNIALNKVLEHKDVIQGFEKQGFEFPQQPNSPQTYSDHVVTEVEKWTEVVTKAELKAE